MFKLTILVCLLARTLCMDDKCSQDNVLKMVTDIGDVLNRLLAGTNPFFAIMNPDSSRYPGVVCRYASELIEEYVDHLPDIALYMERLPEYTVEDDETCPDFGHALSDWTDNYYAYGQENLLTDYHFKSPKSVSPYRLLIDAGPYEEMLDAKSMPDPDDVTCRLNVPLEAMEKMGLMRGVCSGGEPAKQFYYCTENQALLYCFNDSCTLRYDPREELHDGPLTCERLILCKTESESLDVKTAYSFKEIVREVTLDEEECEMYCSNADITARVVYTPLNNPLTKKELYDLSTNDPWKIYVSTDGEPTGVRYMPWITKFVNMKPLLDAGVPEGVLNRFMNYFRLEVFADYADVVKAVAKVEVAKSDAKYKRSKNY